VNFADLGPKEREAAQEALAQTVVNGAGIRHNELFRFARKLKTIASLKDRQARELRSFVLDWWRLSRPFMLTKEWTPTWADFLEGWGKIHTPANGDFMQAMAEKAREKPFDGSDYGYDAATNIVAALCRELQAFRGKNPFYLATRDAGRAAGRSNRWASGALRVLVADGLLVKVREASGRRAPYFRWQGSALCCPM